MQIHLQIKFYFQSISGEFNDQFFFGVASK